MFGWTQNRLLLPVWLGLEPVLDNIQNIHENILQHIVLVLQRELAKADGQVFNYYQSELLAVADKLNFSDLLDQLMQQLNIKPLSNSESKSDISRKRAAALLVLNCLQAQNLSAYRQFHEPINKEIVLLSMIGVAAGMKNMG